MEICMRIKEGFVLRTVMGKTVAVAVGPASKSFRGMISLNSTALQIWNGIERGLSEQEICDEICEKYEVSREKAADDVKKILNTLMAHGVIEND